MSQEKTEPATARKRKKAREDGQVARSAELISCAILLTSLYAIRVLGPHMGSQITEYMTRTFSDAGHGEAKSDTLIGMVTNSAKQTGLIVLPFMGLLTIVGIAGNALQVGVHFTPSLLQPKPSRINPIEGIKKLLTTRSVMELVKSAAKLAIVAIGGWSFIWGHMEDLNRLSFVPAGQIGAKVGDLAYGMSIRMVSILTVLAALDYAYQRMQFERNLRMTKQEVKDEHKDIEGNPEIKARVRQRQREMARRRMMADVPKAAVVIMNPTHFAMALKYELGQKGAPVVVAKGQDLIALKIREIAEEHDVPVVENPPLARMLYDAAEIGQEIPTSLYRAVAEVLAVVWRLNKSMVKA
jgi:flagellar biosynthetic protein FlhB